MKLNKNNSYLKNKSEFPEKNLNKREIQLTDKKNQSKKWSLIQSDAEDEFSFSSLFETKTKNSSFLDVYSPNHFLRKSLEAGRETLSLLRDVNEMLKEEKLSSQSQDLNHNEKHEIVIAADDDVITISSGELFDVKFDVIVKSDSLNNSSLFTDSPVNLSKPLVSSTPIVSNKIKKNIKPLKKLDEEPTSDIEIIYSKKPNLKKISQFKPNDSMDDQELNAILSDVCFKSSNDCSNDIVVINLSEELIQHETPKKMRNSLIKNKKLLRLRRNSKTFFENAMQKHKDYSLTNFLQSSQQEILSNKSSLVSENKFCSISNLDNAETFESEQELQILSTDTHTSNSNRKRTYGFEQENKVPKRVLSDLTNKKVVTEFSKSSSKKSNNFEKDYITSESNLGIKNSTTTSTVINNCDDSFYKDDIEFIEILQKA